MSLATHRTRSVSEIVDATFVLYRAQLATIVTVMMIVIAPFSILKAVLPAALWPVLDLACQLLIPVAQGAIVSIVAAAVERGESLAGGDALRSTSGHAGSLLAATIASGLLVMIGLVLLVVPGVIAAAWTAVVIPVVMLERVGYSKAIERSRALGRGRRGHVLGTLLLSWAIAFLLLMSGGLGIGMLRAGDLATDVLSWLIMAIALPIPTIATALLYYDLRVRTESADLDAMISELPAPAAGA